MSRYVAASRLVVSATCVCVSRLLMGCAALARVTRKSVRRWKSSCRRWHAVQLLRQIGHFHRHASAACAPDNF